MRRIIIIQSSMNLSRTYYHKMHSEFNRNSIISIQALIYFPFFTPRDVKIKKKQIAFFLKNETSIGCKLQTLSSKSINTFAYPRKFQPYCMQNMQLITSHINHTSENIHYKLLGNSNKENTKEMQKSKTKLHIFANFIQQLSN